MLFLILYYTVPLVARQGGRSEANGPPRRVRQRAHTSIPSSALPSSTTFPHSSNGIPPSQSTAHHPPLSKAADDLLELSSYRSGRRGSEGGIVRSSPSRPRYSPSALSRPRTLFSFNLRLLIFPSSIPSDLRPPLRRSHPLCLISQRPPCPSSSSISPYPPL